MLDGIKELVKLDKDWIPKGLGYSLYIRPTLISTYVSRRDVYHCTIVLKRICSHSLVLRHQRLCASTRL